MQVQAGLVAKCGLAIGSSGKVQLMYIIHGCSAAVSCRPPLLQARTSPHELGKALGPACLLITVYIVPTLLQDTCTVYVMYRRESSQGGQGRAAGRQGGRAAAGRVWLSDCLPCGGIQQNSGEDARIL